MVTNKIDYDKIERRIDKFTDGVPKKDGSGRGIRLNKGRAGCDITKEIGGGKVKW